MFTDIDMLQGMSRSIEKLAAKRCPMSPCRAIYFETLQYTARTPRAHGPCSPSGQVQHCVRSASASNRMTHPVAAKKHLKTAGKALILL